MFSNILGTDIGSIGCGSVRIYNEEKKNHIIGTEKV